MGLTFKSPNSMTIRAILASSFMKFVQPKPQHEHEHEHELIVGSWYLLTP